MHVHWFTSAIDSAPDWGNAQESADLCLADLLMAEAGKHSEDVFIVVKRHWKTFLLAKNTTFCWKQWHAYIHIELWFSEVDQKCHERVEVKVDEENYNWRTKSVAILKESAGFQTGLYREKSVQSGPVGLSLGLFLHPDQFCMCGGFDQQRLACCVQVWIRARDTIRITLFGRVGLAN